MEKGDVKIGFGIMGGFNQAQAHAQFVANIADYGMDIQQALEAGRFTKAIVRAAATSNVEALVPGTVMERTRRSVMTLFRAARTGTFGCGQAVMSNSTGVHFGASEPRRDGAAIPEAPPIFTRNRK